MSFFWLALISESKQWNGSALILALFILLENMTAQFPFEPSRTPPKALEALPQDQNSTIISLPYGDKDSKDEEIKNFFSFASLQNQTLLWLSQRNVRSINGFSGIKITNEFYKNSPYQTPEKVLEKITTDNLPIKLIKKGDDDSLLFQIEDIILLTQSREFTVSSQVNSIACDVKTAPPSDVNCMTEPLFTTRIPFSLEQLHLEKSDGHIKITLPETIKTVPFRKVLLTNQKIGCSYLLTKCQGYK